MSDPGDADSNEEESPPDKASAQEKAAPQDEARQPEKEGITENKGPWATLSEKHAALAQLTPEQKDRLVKYASGLSYHLLRGKLNDRDEEDLLSESIKRVLQTRQWDPSRVDFPWFVRGVIRSVANEWFKSAKLTEPADGLLSPTKHDEVTEASLMLEKMREALKERPLVVEIFDLRREGCKAKEIQEQLGISPDVHDANVRWMKRTLRRKGFYHE